jgi:hypothetical protein
MDFAICKRNCGKQKDKEKEKEKCISSVDDVVQHLSCGIKHELINNNRCVLGALTRSALNTTTAFANCKITNLLERVAPDWLLN